jgi:hypothetical protein
MLDESIRLSQARHAAGFHKYQESSSLERIISWLLNFCYGSRAVSGFQLSGTAADVRKLEPGEMSSCGKTGRTNLGSG